MTTKMTAALERSYSMEDTQMALKNMGSFKAPGPNGYHAIFFKRTWHLLREVVHSFVQTILEGGEMLEEASEACVVLIPKEPNPSMMESFRPISLCNVSLQLVSKTIVHRIMEIWKWRSGSALFHLPKQVLFQGGRGSITRYSDKNLFIRCVKANLRREGSS